MKDTQALIEKHGGTFFFDLGDERKGNFERKFKDPEGVTGWVDAAYLMKEPPAASQLAQIKQEKISLTERLRKLETATRSGR